LDANAPSVGDTIRLSIDRIAYGGDGVGRAEGLAVFVPFSAPGDLLDVHVVERKRNFARAAIDRIVTPSPTRREPRCRHFGDCGGCQLQHIDYPAQLQEKSRFVRDALTRVGHIDWPTEVEVRSADEYGYRDRARIRIARTTVEQRSVVTAGFTRGRSHDLCDVHECPVLVPELQRVFSEIRAALVLNSAPAPKEVDATVFGGRISCEPAIVGMDSTAVDRTYSGARYTFMPGVFFQSNRFLIDQLIEEATGVEPGRLALDLYAGVGLFTVHLARKFDKVTAVESDSRAVEFARLNLHGNGIKNVDTVNQRVEQWLERNAGNAGALETGSLDLILLDPPRTGAATAIGHIAELRPKTIKYVSCDPVTCARDLKQLTDAGYRLDRVIAFDMFPQTYHIESVATLRLSVDEIRHVE
jgi:23S rRNA (uracil1939-C5)-methyltransferase